MEFNQRCADWVYETVSKMDDGEARMFALFVADDLHINDIVDNRRVLRGIYSDIQKDIDNGLAPYFLKRLEAGDDPEELVAEAAAVSVAKAFVDNTWFIYQDRDESGQFGHMVGNRYQSKQHKLRNEGPGRHIGEVGALAQRPVERFDREYHQKPGESGATDTLNRMKASGGLVSALGVAFNQPAAVTAGQLATVAGHYGPEAEKVVGPGFRKAAYRYRGTERAPDPRLDRMIEQSSMQVLRNEGRSPVPGSMPSSSLSNSERAWAAQDTAVKYLLGLTPDSFEQGQGKRGLQLKSDLRRKNSRVPSASMADLHRQSGRVTPSEGIMIDAKGRVVAQAVGYGEDHYLPFNLKNLSELKGGAYVRTRESGGLTSEDIYTGLLSGARSMTVVSNSGIFTLHFDDHLRGGRRYNDKAKQMVGRYEHILDAIQSNEVTNPAKRLGPKERAAVRVEIEDRAEKEGWRPTEDQVDEMVTARVKELAKKPRLSEAAEAKIEANAAEIEADQGATAARQYRYAARDEAMQNLAGQNYRLDGEGYQAALQAMKEQFPYYVDDVEVITATRAENNQHSILAELFRNTKDESYVKPQLNRPEGTKAGYFDPSITGKGKHPASETNYQNWGVRRSPQTSAENTGSTGEGAGDTSVEQRISQQGQQRRDRNREADEKVAIKEALQADVQAWTKSHTDTKAADPNGPGVFNHALHPRIMEYNRLDDDEKAAFLDNSQNLKDLAEEVDELFETNKDMLQDAGLPLANYNRTKLLTKKMARPSWSNDKLEGLHVPVAMRLTNDQLVDAQNDPGVRQHMQSSESELTDKSRQTRATRDLHERSGDEDARLHTHEEVRRIELARAVKAHNAERYGSPPAPEQATQPAPQTAPTQALPATPSNPPATVTSDQYRQGLQSGADVIRRSNFPDAEKRRRLLDLFNDPIYSSLSEDERADILQGQHFYRPQSQP